MIRSITGIILSLILTLSCHSERSEHHAETGKKPSESNEAVLVYRGYAVYGHEARTFRPCGEHDPFWAIESGGLLRNLHKELTAHLQPYQEVFAVIEGQKIPALSEGFGAGYSGAISIESVLYAGLEGPSCDYDWNAFRYRAYGNEPFWMVEVADNTMRLSRPDGKDIIWRHISEERLKNGVRYAVIDSTECPVELSITRKSCRDSMSGAYYAFTAVLHKDGEEYHGCALQGTDNGAR